MSKSKDQCRGVQGPDYPGYDSWARIAGLRFLAADGGSFCSACANRENGSLATVAADDPQWKIIGNQMVTDEEEITCDHCDVVIRQPDK